MLQDEFNAHHVACSTGAKRLYDGMATMGSKSSIADTRKQLEQDIDRAQEQYDLNNKNKNPWQGAEQYILPMAIAILAWFLRYFTDACAPVSSKGGREGGGHGACWYHKFG